MICTFCSVVGPFFFEVSMFDLSGGDACSCDGLARGKQDNLAVL